MNGISFIGSAGIPNRYGGFESFLEHCAPAIAGHGIHVVATCDAAMYEDHDLFFHGVKRTFIGVRANGGMSVVHDAVAFWRTFREARAIVVLGVSGGPWFPLFRLACSLTGRRLTVNIDGVEWRRSKFGRAKRGLLWLFDHLAQWSAHVVVYDNKALSPYVAPGCRSKSVCIAYPGDHVPRLPGERQTPGTALTICRIEPENNLELLIEGALASRLLQYTVVGNWSHSVYSKALYSRYKNNPRLVLRDPVYDQRTLATLRERTAIYLHGHSVGGTNPSLVEMLFYDAQILCLDVTFNRETAGPDASYFSSTSDLAAKIDAAMDEKEPPGRTQRERYRAETIALQYIAASLDPDAGRHLSSRP